MWEEPIRVLLVEDNPADARLLVTALQESGPTEFEVEHVSRLTEAEKSLAHGPTDVIALDLSLPDGSGMETVRKTRAMAPGIPIVVMTGSGHERLASEVMREGVQDFLVKGRLDCAPARALRHAVQRRRAEESSPAGEEKLRRLVDGVEDYAILMLDADGRVGSWNHGAELIYGYSAAEILGRHFSCLSTPEASRAGYPELKLRLAAEAGRFEEQGWQYRNDGSRFWADLIITALRSDSGALRGFAKVTRDVTRRGAIELQVLQLKEAAEAASKSKDHFLAVVSHELRTPLTPVLGLLSHLASQADHPEALRTDLRTIRRNVEVAARLIDDLLDTTRIVRDKVELRHEIVDAHAVIAAALGAFRTEIGAKELKSSIALRATRHHVWADPDRLHQVFVNLLSNAVKFTPEGGTIAVSSSNEADGRLRAQICDSGIGIEPHALPFVFRRFEQGERTVTRKYGGLGLGLSICKSLVEMHQGRIDISSGGKDKGTTLTVELISAQPDGATFPIEGTDSVPRAERRRILLVEDHDDTRRIMVRLLTSFGCSVLSAGSVKEALATADGEEFDLLVSDIRLPDGTGIDLMKQMKARRHLKGIAVSGLSHEADLRRIYEAGFDLHLTKPLDLPALEEAIRRMLG